MPSNRQHTFGVIGFGRFGKLWAKELSAHGRTLVYDKNRASSRGALPRGVSFVSLKDVAQKSDILFLTVPISAIEQTCKALHPLLRRDTLVVDTCSVKVVPVRGMKNNLSGNQPILGTHPLFGPDSAKRNGGIKGFKIAVCPVRISASRKKEVLSLFSKLGLESILTTPQKHDRFMAPSQALVHLIGRGLGPLSLKPQPIATPDYDALLRMRDIVVNDTWELFSDMQRQNPFTTNLRDRFIRNLEALDIRIADYTDIGTLRKEFEKVDRNIIALLARRSELSRAIGKYKKKHALPINDPAREKNLTTFHRARSHKEHLDPAFVETVFRPVITRSKDIQKKLP